MKRRMQASRTPRSKGMTLRQLSDFVSACGRAGLDPDAVVKARLRFGNGIDRLIVDIEEV